MNEPLRIDLRNITKRYDKLTAVDNLSLALGPGEIFGFIGPNGAGKTTTIKILATLLEPTTGTAFVDGINVVENPDAVRARIGYMPDTFGVYDEFKVWEYLDFFAAAYKVPKGDRPGLIDLVLDLTTLSNKKDAYVEGLSRGMKQRLCLAKTLVHDPPVLILDEPTSGLDPRARIEVKALLKELRKMGKTILISSHILSELADCCTSIGIIERGQLLMHGTIDSVYRQIRRNRIVEIRFVENQDAGISIVRSDPAMRGIEIDGNRVTAEFETDDQGLSNLMKKLVDGGVKMRSFSDKDPTLADVFMLVTKGLVA